MAEILLPQAIPVNDRIVAQPEIGFIFDDAAREVVGAYGENPTPDTLTITLTNGGRDFSFDLPAFMPRREVRIPGRFRPAEVDRVHRGIAKKVIEYESLAISRTFAEPHTGSPTVLGVTQTQFSTMSTTHSASQGATVDAGDGLLVFCGGSDTAAGDQAYGWTPPAGYAEIADVQYNDAGAGDIRNAIGVHFKEAAGDEDGVSVNFATSIAVAGVVQVYRLDAGTYDPDRIEASAKAQGESGSYDPPSLTVSWGSADNRWFVAVAKDNNNPASTAPSGYSSPMQHGTANSTADMALDTAHRAATVETENPAAASTTNEKWVTVTVGVGPSGSAAQDLTGSLFQKAPTFFQGAVTTGVVDLAGQLFAKAPTFPTGTITPGVVDLAGVLFEKAPTFFSGTVALDDSQALTGSPFQSAPSFFQGEIVRLLQELSGTLFQNTPTFPTGTVTPGDVDLTGTLFQKAPSFFGGAVDPGAVSLSGILFESAPLFPTGRVFRVVVHPPNPTAAVGNYSAAASTMNVGRAAAITPSISTATAAASSTAETDKPTSEAE